ncbi:MAG: LPXTG cell wall anchor domain-containing protein [Candidatus Shapirobacteria bacterium]|jgi:uncharacterized repeat protein (TIGR01451 family)/LPXTG-motif cell wall-anchored protein
MRKNIAAFVLALLFSLNSISPVLADEEYRKIEVDLKAKGFADSIWVNNLEQDKVLFGPGDKFQVQITVKNLGNRTQTQTKVTQTLPSVLTTSDPLTYTIPEINPGSEVVKYVTVTVKDKPFVNQAVTKSEISAYAKTEIGTEGKDWTYFFTNNGTKEIQKSSDNGGLPATGTNQLVLGTTIGVSLIGIALFGRRFARGY